MNKRCRLRLNLEGGIFYYYGPETYKRVAHFFPESSPIGLTLTAILAILEFPPVLSAFSRNECHFPLFAYVSKN